MDSICKINQLYPCLALGDINTVRKKLTIEFVIFCSSGARGFPTQGKSSVKLMKLK